MLLAHFGVSVFIVGVTMVSGFSTESDVRMEVGDTTAAGQYQVRMDGVKRVVGPNYVSSRASLSITENGKPVTLSNPIQVERSYQYNEASVSTDDLQGDQIRDWLYDSLARRITDQYVAISLPKVTSAGASKPIPVGNGSTSTAVVVPKP